MLKQLRIVAGLVHMARDPSDYARVERFRKTLRDYGYFRRAAKHVTADPATRSIMNTKPLLEWTPSDLERLRRLPPGTLGHELAGFLARNQIVPLGYHHEPTLSDEEFLIRRVVQTHDIWHVVLGFETDAIGELGINTFMLAQIRWPPAGFYVSGYLLRQMIAQPDDAAQILRSVARGWSLAQVVRPLFGVLWEQLWDRPLVELQQELGVPLPGLAASQAIA